MPNMRTKILGHMQISCLSLAELSLPRIGTALLALSQLLIAACGALYMPSKYDVRANEYSPELAQIKGYAKNHVVFNEVIKFGNLSILTLNAYVGNDLLETMQGTFILDLIDTHHPTIFALQGLSKEAMEYIKNKTSGHYAIAAEDVIEIDQRTREILYKPVLYDTGVLEKVFETSFNQNSKAQTYATFTIFRRKNTGQEFILINVDLFSADPAAIDLGFFEIKAHLNKSRFENYPILVTGTINTMSKKLEKAMDVLFINPLRKDEKNNGESFTTFHGLKKMNDGIQRDFILQSKKTNMFKPNYARILKLWNTSVFEHYPVYTILTMDNQSPAAMAA